MNCAISSISRPYSSYASASLADQRRSSRTGAAVVVHPPQVVLLEGSERPVERQDLETVLRKLELADDLGAESETTYEADA